MWPERAPVGVGHPRVAYLLAHECRRDVALSVTGGDEHQRQGNELTMALADKGCHGLGHWRPGQLDEATGGGPVWRVVTALEPAHERVELSDSRVAAGPVAYYQHR